MKVVLDDLGMPTSTSFEGKLLSAMDSASTGERVKIYKEYVECLSKRFDASELATLGIGALNYGQ